jgi:hypothetical protein
MLVFDICGSTLFTPLTVALKVLQSERLFAVSAFALDVTHPRIVTCGHSGEVGGNDASIGDLDESVTR